MSKSIDSDLKNIMTLLKMMNIFPEGQNFIDRSIREFHILSVLIE